MISEVLSSTEDAHNECEKKHTQDTTRFDELWPRKSATVPTTSLEGAKNALQKKRKKYII